jgi:hypothetical protein
MDVDLKADSALPVKGRMKLNLDQLLGKSKYASHFVELKADYPVAHKTLKDFQKLYGDVGPANYHWYQCKFAQLGYKLYPQLKIGLIKKVIENYSPGGENLDGISLLKKLAPDTMDEWLKEMQ